MPCYSVQVTVGGAPSPSQHLLPPRHVAAWPPTNRCPCNTYRPDHAPKRAIETAYGPGRAVVVVAAGGKSTSTKGKTSSGKGFGASHAPSVSKSGVSQTCACGSKIVYRECCEPYHSGAAVPGDVEAALRARFCAFVKGRVPYLLATFHPLYHSFKYEGSAPGGSTAQLRRDLEAATKCFTYSNLKVLEVRPGSTPDEAFITFRYSSINKNNPEKDWDGSVKWSTTVERSRFLRDSPAVTGGASGPWLFADYELIDYPSWMEDAKQAELRGRGQAAQPVAGAV